MTSKYPKQEPVKIDRKALFAKWDAQEPTDMTMITHLEWPAYSAWCIETAKKKIEKQQHALRDALPTKEVK